MKSHETLIANDVHNKHKVKQETGDENNVFCPTRSCPTLVNRRINPKIRNDSDFHEISELQYRYYKIQAYRMRTQSEACKIKS